MEKSSLLILRTAPEVNPGRGLKASELPPRRQATTDSAFETDDIRTETLGRLDSMEKTVCYAP